MNHMNHVNWTALVEHEAHERAYAHQERLFDAIRRNEYESVLGRLRCAMLQWQSKLAAPKGAGRWQMLRLRDVLARLL